MIFERFLLGNIKWNFFFFCCFWVAELANLSNFRFGFP